MPASLEYKCPCCGGSIVFDSQTQMMTCPYCDTEFDLETLKAYDEILKHQKPDDLEWKDSPDEWADDNINLYVCKSCGGELVADQNTAATACPYCGNPIVLTGRLAGDLKPDYVIPFKVDKEAAKSALKKHIYSKKLVPKAFRDEHHIDEIRGIYVPFWLFDTNANGTVTYKATRVHVWSDKDYDYTDTSFYHLIRSGTIDFDRVPGDGSSKMDDTLMESIEPYDFTEAVDFQTAYLSGYLADRYDVNAADMTPRVNERVKASFERTMGNTTPGYATVTPEHSDVQLVNSRISYALYPVWILNTKWGDKDYLFAMNGQTGKFVGDLPVDKGAFWRWFFLLAAAIAGGITLVLLLITLL